MTTDLSKPATPNQFGERLRTDKAGHTESAILLIGRALLASLFPALRAAAIDPVTAIRED